MVRVAECLARVRVALLTESVDRNTDQQSTYNGVNTSLSSRRAWIEIRLVPG